MSRVSFEVPPDQKLVLVDQARSLGVSLATYARNLVLDGSKRERHGQHVELLRAIRAEVMALVYFMGRMQKLPPENLQAWIQLTLARYEKALLNNVGRPAGDSVAEEKSKP